MPVSAVIVFAASSATFIDLLDTTGYIDDLVQVVPRQVALNGGEVRECAHLASFVIPSAFLRSGSF